VGPKARPSALHCVSGLATIVGTRQNSLMMQNSDDGTAGEGDLDRGAADARASTRSGRAITSRVVGAPVAEPAPETARLYAAEWARFAAWCRQARRVPLPASSATLAAHLAAAAPGLSRGALGRRRAAIVSMHRQHNLPPPRVDPATQADLRASARLVSRSRRDPVQAVSSLLRVAAGCPRDRAGLRDRSLLLLVAATGRSRLRPPRDGCPDDERDATATPVALTVLLGLDAEHVHPTTAGVSLVLRARSNDAEPNRAVSLTRHPAAGSCPVRALEDWLSASDTAFGPVFRKVDRWGNVEHARLAPDAWSRILARRSGAPRRRDPNAGS